MPTARDYAGGIADGFLRWLDRIAEDGILRMFLRWVASLFGRRMIAKKLIAGERIIAEVRHSGLLYVPWVLLAVAGLVLAAVWLPQVPARSAWFAIAVVLAVLGYALYRSLVIARDRLVVTDSRVFRVWGVFSLHEAEMEIVRVLDVTVLEPLWLRPFNSGHVILENAAQEQGLRVHRYVPEPSEVARSIHTRRRQMMGLVGDDESGTQPEKPTLHPSQHPRRPGRVTARRITS